MLNLSYSLDFFVLCDARAVTGRTGRIWTNAPGVVVSDAAGSFQLRNLKKEQSLTTPGNEVTCSKCLRHVKSQGTCVWLLDFAV